MDFATVSDERSKTVWRIATAENSRAGLAFVCHSERRAVAKRARAVEEPLCLRRTMDPIGVRCGDFQQSALARACLLNLHPINGYPGADVSLASTKPSHPGRHLGESRISCEAEGRSRAVESVEGAEP